MVHANFERKTSSLRIFFSKFAYKQSWNREGNSARDSQEGEGEGKVWSVVQRIGLTSEAPMLTNWANNVAAFATGTFASRHVTWPLSLSVAV